MEEDIKLFLIELVDEHGMTDSYLLSLRPDILNKPVVGERGGGIVLGEIPLIQETEHLVLGLCNLNSAVLDEDLGELPSALDKIIDGCIKRVKSINGILIHRPGQGPTREEIRQAIIQRLLDIEYPPGTEFHKEDPDTWDAERQMLVLKVGWNNMSLEELVAGLSE